MQPGAVWFPEHKRTLPEKRKLKAKAGRRGHVSPSNHHSRHALALEEGQVRKANGPYCLDDATQTMEDILFKIDKSSTQNQSNGKLLGSES